MVDATHVRYKAADRSYFSILKKEIHQQAFLADFDANKLGDLDIVVSEMTSNLHKYAKEGEILCGIFTEGNLKFIELLCLDQGPGMADTGRMMTDGFSSSNTMGMGLGSIKRLSDVFDIYSQKDWGTIILCRIYSKTLKVKPNGLPMMVRPLVICMPGQQKSGDGIYFKSTDQYFKLLVADGLGHGEEANRAVNEAVIAFKTCPYHSPSEVIRYLHNSIRKTRGAVATVVVFDFKDRSWKIAGVGNISARLSSFAAAKNIMSYNGIVGHNIPNTINDQSISAQDYSLITLCSDGIKSRWDLNKLPGIGRADLSIQAAAIYKEFGRQTDDMTVIIAKPNQK